MLRSMTGYGRGQAQSKTVTIVVELKSVNNRFRDIQLRVPREYMVLEPRLNAMLKGPFQRGRIDVFVRRTILGSQSRVTADVALANEYANVINELTAEMVGFVGEIPFGFILGQSGVLNVTELPVDVMSEWDVVETAMESAIADLLQMRETEGKASETTSPTISMRCFRRSTKLKDRSLELTNGCAHAWRPVLDE